ncbi:MAG: hypothetical protein IT385_02490 [Deltaproteobacteria bacterium]|nr:hypothetical protein [Deltaproteobacteria bacterium]
MGTEVRRFGVRHHGPGSARSLVAALAAWRPEVVLVEGPPEADKILSWAADEGMRPPVAILVYAVAEPTRAVFYPFAEFSPEWQAIRWALGARVPVRFIDLPAGVRLSDRDPHAATRLDPLAALSLAAGYDDPELWWERQVEQRRDASNLFEAIEVAMGALRAASEDEHPITPHEARREAHMRRAIREACETAMRVAVVCGAWHVPALDVHRFRAKDDDKLLKGLAKTKMAAVWIPWTDARLGQESGYGAGVAAPGWYRHLFAEPLMPSVGWAARAARVLREADLEASSAAAVEVVRLAEALAALRDLAMAGLPELRESILTILCAGDPAWARIVTRRLEVGEAVGLVPVEAPQTPLQEDVHAQARTLRVPRTGDRKVVELDLRKDHDRAKSIFFQRLRVLEVPWAEPSDATSSGTFREGWVVQWTPELEVGLIDAARHGSTLVQAATAVATQRARETTEPLPALARRLDAALLADLPLAADALLTAIAERAAAGADVVALLGALPPLARVARYSDVRGTEVARVVPLLRGLFDRAVVELPIAAAQVDDQAAADLVRAIDEAGLALGLLADPELDGAWREALDRLAPDEGRHPLVRGRATRLLLDAGLVDPAELERRARLALGRAQSATRAGAWIEGLVAGSGLSLIHHDGLWAALDGWLVALSAEDFTLVLALLRRGFSSFSASERRAMARRLARAGGLRATAVVAAVVSPWDEARARRVDPVLVKLLGDRP